MCLYNEKTGGQKRFLFLELKTNPTVLYMQENSDIHVKALKLNAVFFLIRYLLGLL